MSLLSMQRDFGAWLREGSDPAAEVIGRAYRPGLDVYLNNYRAQLVATLEASFARTHAWIGDEAFRHAVIAHIDRVPPSGWTLDHYGRDFGATLAQLYPGHVEVAELAAIEWAIAEAFVAADHDPIDAAALGAVDWDCATLLFSPTIRLVDVATNVFDIWLALVEDRVPPPAEQPGARWALLVWRDAQGCQVRPLDDVEGEALRRGLEGPTFSDLCAALVAELGETEGVATSGALLGQWITAGLLAAVDSSIAN